MLKMAGQAKRYIDLLQEANKQNNHLLERLEEECGQRDRFESRCNELYKEKCRVENQLFCLSCQEEKKLTRPGKTFVLCGKCADIITDWKKTVKALEEKASYWEERYNSVLEEHSVLVKCSGPITEWKKSVK